jgi:hypothetical protein
LKTTEVFGLPGKLSVRHRTLDKKEINAGCSIAARPRVAPEIRCSDCRESVSSLAGRY